MRSLLYGAWGLWCICVVVGSVLPSESTAMSVLDALLSQAHISDKIEHSGAYLVLALIPALLLRDRKRLIAVLVGFVLMGLALEIAQNLAPGREPDWRDFVANVAGILAGCWVGLALRRQQWLQWLSGPAREEEKRASFQ